MVKEEKLPLGTRGRLVGGPINVFKRGLDLLGFKPHYYRTAQLELAPTKQMRPYYQLLKTMLGKLGVERGIEDNFKFIEGRMKPEVEKIFKELGQYYNSETILIEKDFPTNGTGEKKVKIEILGKEYGLEIPDEREVRFPDGYIQKVTYYGFTKSPKYWFEKYEKLVNKVFEDATDYYMKECEKQYPQNIKVKNTVTTQLNQLKARYLLVLEALFAGKNKEILGFTSIYQKDLDAESGFSKMVQNTSEKLKTLRNQIFERLPKEVLYRRTYLVVVPYYYDKKEKKYVDLTENELPIKKEYGEFEVGKDEYGMPFEVADDYYEFMGKGIDKGTILIDVFEGRPNPRKIEDERFLEELPLIEIVNYACNEWDEYRDDFRDGRYHKNSLTVTDYIMAANKALGEEWKTKTFPWWIGSDYKRYNMTLGDKQIISGERIPTNLNPAFDLRAMKKGGGAEFLHLGKKRYYGDFSTCEKVYPDKTKDKIWAPVITTRGLSMFIIEHICRKGKSLKEIHEDLVYVAKEETGGYDYGPRTFGTPFCMDPFNVNYVSVNEALKRAFE